MVDFKTPRITPTARAAGQVSNAGSQALGRLKNATQGVADNFTEFWEKEAAIQGEEIIAEAQEEWGRTYAERAKTAGNGFAKGILSDYDTYVQERLQRQDAEAEERGQAHVPKRNRREVKAALDKYRMRLEGKALSREAAARAAAKRAVEAKTQRLKLNALISDPGLLPEYLETAKTQGERGDYVKTALGMDVRNNPQGVKDDLMSGKWDADISPASKMSMVKLADSGIERQKREDEIAIRADQQRYEAELSEEIAFAEANGALPVDSIFDETEHADLYANDPEKGAQVKELYKDSVVFAETLSSVSMASPEQLVAEADSLQKQVELPGKTQADVKKMNAFAAAIDQRNTAIRNDGASYVQKNVDAAGQLYNLLGEAEPEAAPVVAKNYANTMDLMYDRLGVPDELRTVIPKRDAEAQVARFNEMGTDVAAQAFTEYMNVWGDAGPRVLAQLDKAGLAKEYSVAMRHSDNPGLSQAIINLSSIDTKELTAGLLSSSVKDVRTELSEMMVDYRSAFEFAGGGDAQEMMNKHYAVAEKFALDMVRRGSDPSDAVERAVSQMFPEDSVIENNARYIRPLGLDNRAVGRGLDNLMDDEALRGNIADVDDPRFPDFADMDVTISSASRTGIWVNNSAGDGLQLMISMDGYLLPLNTKEGDPYGFTFQEIEAAGEPKAFIPRRLK